jgi:hypothetical protein
MKRRCSTVALATAAVAFVGISLSGCGGGGPDSGSAQNAAGHAGAAAPAAPADDKYAPLAKLPDWSGVWEPARMAGPPKPGVAPPAPPAPPKLTPKYAAQYEAFQEKNKKTPGLNFVTNVANCVPAGLPGSMLQPYPIEFLVTPGRVTIAIETYSVVRRIYTDGTPMPAEPDPSYQGTSIGHWEGDTLVVETTGILPETSPIGGIIGHGPNMKVTERIHLVDPDVLEIQTTLEDPEVFTEPYTMVNHYARHRDWKIMEYVCAQNNHDFVDEKGNAGFSLKRNPGE